jgi:hypothetical protein
VTWLITARLAGAAPALVTHPALGASASGVSRPDALAGGAAYARVTDAIPALTKLDRPRGSAVTSTDRETDEQVEQSVKHNRILRLVNTRLGPGQGMALAFNFGVRRAGVRGYERWLGG